MYLAKRDFKCDCNCCHRRWCFCEESCFLDVDKVKSKQFERTQAGKHTDFMTMCSHCLTNYIEKNPIVRFLKVNQCPLNLNDTFYAQNSFNALPRQKPTGIIRHLAQTSPTWAQQQKVQTFTSKMHGLCSRWDVKSQQRPRTCCCSLLGKWYNRFRPGSVHDVPTSQKSSLNSHMNLTKGVKAGVFN